MTWGNRSGRVGAGRRCRREQTPRPPDQHGLPHPSPAQRHQEWPPPAGESSSSGHRRVAHGHRGPGRRPRVPLGARPARNRCSFPCLPEPTLRARWGGVGAPGSSGCSANIGGPLAGLAVGGRLTEAPRGRSRLSAPEPANATLFGKRVCADVLKLRATR